jgi:hypothetical protein
VNFSGGVLLIVGPEVRAAVPFGTQLSVFDAEAGVDLEKPSESVSLTMMIERCLLMSLFT